MIQRELKEIKIQYDRMPNGKIFIIADECDMEILKEFFEYKKTKKPKIKK